MKLEETIKWRKIIKKIFIYLSGIFLCAVIALVDVFIFTNKYKWNMTTTYISIGIACVVLLIAICLVLIKILYLKIEKKCNSLIKPITFYLNGKKAYQFIKESGYKTVDTLLFSNEIHYETEGYNCIRSDISIIKGETDVEHAKIYIFSTKYHFIEHYLLSHSLNISGFDVYHKEALGNTNIYLTDLLDISNMNVDFSSNFYISFKGNLIYFIDFNKRIMDIEKEKITNENFIKYIDEEKIDIENVYCNLIKLK